CPGRRVRQQCRRRLRGADRPPARHDLLRTRCGHQCRRHDYRFDPQLYHVAEQYADAHTDSDADADTDAHTDSDADADTDAHTDADAHAHPDTLTDAHPDTDSHIPG